MQEISEELRREGRGGRLRFRLGDCLSHSRSLFAVRAVFIGMLDLREKKRRDARATMRKHIYIHIDVHITRASHQKH